MDSNSLCSPRSSFPLSVPYKRLISVKEDPHQKFQAGRQEESQGAGVGSQSITAAGAALSSPAMQVCAWWQKDEVQRVQYRERAPLLPQLGAV